MWHITSKPQTIKRPPDNIEGTEVKKPRTAQTDGPGFSIAAESPMDETGHEFGDPSDHAPDNASLDVPRSTALRLQETLLEIPWELIQKCFDFPVMQVDPLIVESGETLRNSTRSMRTLARINMEMNKRTKAQYGEQLAPLRWTHQLTLRQSYWLNNYGNPSTKETRSNIQILIDENAYEPTLRRAAPQHTRALMVAAGDGLHTLYTELQYRVAFKHNLRPHMDWDQLAVHALLVGYLKFGSGDHAFVDLETDIRRTLHTFSLEAQAQVCADLVALRSE